MSSTGPGYDTRRYECCAPFYGEVGEEFTRRFRPEFEGALHSYVDAYASLYEHVVLQNDPGSPAAVAAGGGTGAAIVTAYNQRLKKSFGLIRRHVEDPTLRDDIDANAMGDGPAAWTIITNACTMPQTFLNLANQDTEWINTHITEVGYTQRTVENYRALLQRINRERAVADRKTDSQVWQKLLEGIMNAGCAELATLVRNEMQRPTMVHAAGTPLAGQPDIAAAVMYFAERWRSLLKDGSIKPLPPRKRSPPMGNRVDAMQATLSTPSPPSSPPYTEAMPIPAMAATNTQEAERMCYNCRGFGHVKLDANGKTVCPSPIRSRPISHCIQRLEAEKRREAGKFNRRKIFIRRNKAVAKSALDINSDELEIDDDHNVYDATGVCIGSLVEEEVETEQPETSSVSVHAATALETPVKNMGLRGSPVKANSDDTKMRNTVRFETALPSPDQFNVDVDFESSFVSPAMIASVNDTDELPEIDEARPRPERRRTAIVLAGVLGIAAVVAPPRTSRFLMLASIACLSTASAFQVTPNRVRISHAFLANADGVDTANAVALDTGASMHVSGRRELFPVGRIAEHKPNIAVEVANNAKCTVEFKGAISLPVKYRKHIASATTEKGVLTLRDALYVPSLGRNTLISPKSMFHNEGIRCYFNDDKYCRTNKGRIIDIVETQSLYVIPLIKLASPSTATALTSKASSISADELHSRCMHFSMQRILRSVNSLDNYIPSADLNHNCQNCRTASARRHSSPASNIPHFTRYGQCICSDTCDMGEYSIPFGFRYFITFLDVATKYLMVYFLRTHKHAEVRAVYLQYLTDSKRFLPNGRIEIWYMDNGSEFAVSWGVGKDKPGYHANDTDSWLAEYFTRRRFVVPWNPQQNPAESANRILLRPLRACLAHAGVSTRYWPFGIHQGAIVHNILVTDSKTAVHAMGAMRAKLASFAEYATTLSSSIPSTVLSPYAMVHKSRFDFSKLHTLFCECFVVIRNPADIARRPKAAPRTARAVHLGLDHRRAGYFVYIIEFERFTTSAYHDTLFIDESKFPPLNDKSLPGEVRQQDAAMRLPTEEFLESDRTIPEVHLRPPGNEANTDRAERDEVPDRPSARTRSRTALATLCKLRELTADFVVVAAEGDSVLAMKADIWRPMVCPNSVDEALAQDYEGWMHAYKTDFEAKAKNGTFKFVPRLPHMKVHKLGWAHKLVWNEDNSLAELRARLVGRGYSQIQGVDYVHSYSATPRASAVRIFESAICAQDLREEHCDVVKAFTQNNVDDVELIVELPRPLPPVLDKDGEPMVAVLQKALEGLKQSGFLHQKNHSATFTENEVVPFVQCETEPTLFIHVDKDIRIMALVWTDDVRFAYNSAASERYELFLSEVYGKRWNYKRKGEARKFVGLSISRDRVGQTVTLSAAPFIEGIFRRFVPQGHPPRNMPYKSAEALKSIKPATTIVQRKNVKDKPYLAAVASCIWIYSVLRADIAFVLNVLCSVMHDPTLDAWHILVDMISYLHATKDVGISYRSSHSKWSIPHEITGSRRDSLIKQHGFMAYCDSSWSTPSTAGYVIMIMGGPLDWATKTIKVICHSSAEAEVSAGSLCVKALMYCRQVCLAVGLDMCAPTCLLLDSEAGIAIGTNNGVSPRTAHFLRWQHYMRWANSHKYIDLVFMSGKRQVADAITKAVDPTLLREFRKHVYGQ